MDTPHQNHHEHDNTAQESGQVFYLPHATTGDSNGNDCGDPVVIDAEIVDDTPTDSDQPADGEHTGERSGERSAGRALERSRVRLPWRAPSGQEIDHRVYGTFGYRRIIPYEARERMAEAGGELAERSVPAAKSGGKAVLREVCYVGRGAVIVAQRLWEAKTNSAYERALREARAEGNTELYLELESRGERARESRHKRRMQLIKEAPLALVKALAGGAALAAGLLLMLGIVLAIGQSDAGMILAPISGVISAITWTYWFFASYGALLLLGGTVIAVAGLRHLGQQDGYVPRWVAPETTEPDKPDQIPDEGAILTALRHLGIQALNEAFKQGWAPRWISGTCRDGKGWHTQLQMPLGVPVVEVVKRRDKLAHNLMRQPVEVWPTEPKKQPTVLDLWVADQGALSGPVEPWPLLHEGSTDFFQGVPVGVDIRGDVITGRLFEANYAVAGMMGSGKSTLIITLLLGALLDPLVEADVFVFAENADYDPLTPRLRTLTTGAEPENITACAELLKDLFSDLAVRGKALQEHGERKVTRALAEKDHRLRPRIVVIDECQNLFLSEHGDMAEELVVKLITTARKYGIVLIFATPEPSSDSLPRKVVAVISNKACHAIGDQQSNDAILGTGSYKAGISAVDLEPKTSDGPGDIGTAMCRGFRARPGLMRSFYLRKEAGIDEVTPIVTRALNLREQTGLTIEADTVDDDGEELDPLADIAAVLADAHVARMRTQEVLQRLAERNPAYRDWTFNDLTGYLTAHDAAPYKSGGHKVVSAARIHESITERDRNRVTESEGGG